MKKKVQALLVIAAIAGATIIAAPATPAGAGEPVSDACSGWGPAAPVWTTIEGASGRDAKRYVGDQPFFCPDRDPIFADGSE